jgi:hypothetical protein
MDTSDRARSPDVRRGVVFGPGAGRWRRLIAATLVALIGYAAADILLPLHRDPTRFDPIATGTLETNIWRSYYDRQNVALFLQLAQTLRTQFHLPLLRSYVGAYYGAAAAFRFKDGKARSDYEQALPALRSYFELIHNTSNRNFDVTRTAALELEWWIVHRQRDRYPHDALGRACAAATASLYLVPAAATLEHGQLRAEAMLLRDAREEAGSVTEKDWATIESLLRRSYLSLSRALAPADAAASAQ